MSAAAAAAYRPLRACFATSLAVQGVNVVTGILLARTLGPGGRGELAAVLLWPAVLAAVGSLGLFEASAFYAARATAAGTLAGTALVLIAGQSVLLVGIGLLVVPIALHGYGPGAVGAAYVFLAYIPLNLTAVSFMWILNGLQRFSWFQWLRLVTLGVTVAGLASLAAAHGLTVWRAAIVYVAANAVTAIVAGVLLRRAGARPLAFSLDVARQILRFGVRSHLGNVSSLLNERLDQLVISLFLAPAKLGLYVIAVTISSATTLVGSSVALIALPSIARLEGDSRRAEAGRRYVGITVVSSVAVTLPLLVFAPQLIRLFFGDSFTPAADVARVLLAGAIVFSTNRVLGAVLQAVGRPLDAGVGECLALGATFAGLAILLPTLGLMGAGVASVLAYSASTVWMTRRATRALGVPASRLLAPDPKELAPPWPARLRPLAPASVPAVRERGDA